MGSLKPDAAADRRAAALRRPPHPAAPAPAPMTPESPRRTTARLGIIGGGAWGTALACAAHRAGTPVVLWVREPEVVATLERTRENEAFLPGVRIAADIAITANLAEATAADLVLLAVPTQYLRRLAGQASVHWPPDLAVVSCAKGLEQPGGVLPSDILAEVLPGRPCAVLSGPTFAAEVARGLPTAVTCAATDAGLADRVAAALGDRLLRIYRSDDVVGVQLGGAIKNVLAIAAGIVTGRNLGDNARAAIITRGVAEMARLVEACGGRRDTVMGLSGLGDLILTATSPQSRNTSLGIAVGRGETLESVLGARKSVAEGASTAAAVLALAARAGVEMPICRAVAAVVAGGADLDAVIDGLLERPVARELP